ncbi:MAG: hypothetical protein IJO70_02880 [Lachnospiraceae bacterium]|nr:hypothetical protein [Lachnospiraceae bacterium]
MKKRYVVIVGVAIILGLVGCADNPDDSIIQNKDFDNLIEEAENTEESVNMEEMSQDVEVNYDTYVTNITDENLHVTVNVDAKVDIPATDKLSVYRVKQADVSQEMLDKVRNTLVPDVKLYDGAVLMAETKETLESEIQLYKDELAALDNGTSSCEPGYEDSYREECLGQIKYLEEKYENAPATIPLEDNESDYMLHTVAEKYAENPNSEYYMWQNELTTEGDEVFFGISDGKNGEYISLYVQNNEDYGNVIRYTKNSIGHTFATAVSVGGTSSLELYKDGEQSQVASDNGIAINCTDKETLNMSIDDARTQADKLLSELGLNDFACSHVGKYNEIPDIRNTTDLYYRPVYKFTYLRTIDNTMISNEAGTKHFEEWSGDDYVKKDWGGETIVVMVNDTGIVGLYYNSPIEITETMVEKSQLKTFDEVKGTFEEMVVIVHGVDDASLGKEEVDYHKNIEINNVVLRYARISEADNFDSGLLVPVWDFEGEIDDYNVSYLKEAIPDSVLTINAIDGSIIDHTLGY